MVIQNNLTLDTFMSIDVVTKIMDHPSKIERRKLEEARKKRLEAALRENIRKRKAQVKGRSEGEESTN
jgi:hypothetical protein